MPDGRRALRGWEPHVTEITGVAAAWRKDLLVRASGQFVALVAAVAAWSPVR